MVVGIQVIARTNQCMTTCYRLSKFLTNNSRNKFAVNAQRRLLSTTYSMCNARKYTDKHEWVMFDGKIGTVGISHYAQDALGDVVFAQLPEPGQDVTQKEECGALESVKAASELYSPVTGTVTEKNTAVEEKPGLINMSCYDKGWLFKVELTKPEELNALMDEDQYQRFLNTHE